MNLTTYRKITRAKYDSAVGNGTDNSTDQTNVDPNKYLAMPIDRRLNIAFLVLSTILATLLIIKELKRFQ